MVFRGEVIFSSSENWKTSQDVLKIVHRELSMAHIRLCMVWNSDVSTLLSRTSTFSLERVDQSLYLNQCWKKMLEDSSKVWKNVVNGCLVSSETFDEWDKIEEDLVQGDDEILVDNVVGDADLELDNGPNLEWVHL